MKPSMSKLTEMAQLINQVNINLVGDHLMVISRYEQLLMLSQSQIKVQLQHKYVTIHGEDLVVNILTVERLEVTGTIEAIRFEGR